jgi:hypothetical protein
MRPRLVKKTGGCWMRLNGSNEFAGASEKQVLRFAQDDKI